MVAAEVSKLTSSISSSKVEFGPRNVRKKVRKGSFEFLQEPARAPRRLPVVGVRGALLGDVGRLRTAAGRGDAAVDPRHDEEEDGGGGGGRRRGR